MSDYQLPPSVVDVFRDLTERVARLENSRRAPRYLTASRPAASTNPGLVIFVSDAAAGSKFQGSDGSSWVSLG